MARDEHHTEVERIRTNVHQFRNAQIYITFAELGIGNVLQHGPLTLDELADSINVDRVALKRFLDAAIAFDLIAVNDNDLYALTELGFDLYAPASPRSLANSLRLEGAFYRRWARLTQAIRIGGRPEENRRQEDDSGWVRMFTMALYENSREAATAVARTISHLLPSAEPGNLHVLDLGGGHGGYAIALARERSDVDATVFDMPAVVEVTREIIDSNGMSDRVKTIAGDFHFDPIGTDYDAILLFGVLHGETQEGASRLLGAIREALRPDGLLIIRSRGKPTSEPEPGEREIFDLHMLLSTEGGRVQRAADTRTVVEDHGFAIHTEQEISPPGTGHLLVFQRSGAE
jgi:SAM-dependent methyltransferase